MQFVRGLFLAFIYLHIALWAAIFLGETTCSDGCGGLMGPVFLDILFLPIAIIMPVVWFWRKMPSHKTTGYYVNTAAVVVAFLLAFFFVVWFQLWHLVGIN